MKSIQQLLSLKGRVALVTGGAGHVGVAICEALAELGAKVVVLDLFLAACSLSIKRMKRKYQTKMSPLRVDLNNEGAIKEVPCIIRKRFGRLDILINNAALVGTSQMQGWIVPFNEQSSSTWRKALEVNLTAPFVLAQACAGELKRSGSGSIINIASIYGIVGPDMCLYKKTSLGNPAAYAASKGGLIQLTRWLATVLAPKIRVNAISLGGVLRNQPKVFQARCREKTPLRRMAKEEDIKGAIAFLASDLSSYVTGHNLVVDGGWTAW